MKLKFFVLVLLLCIALPCLATDKEIYGQWRYSQQEKAFDKVEKSTTVAVSQTNVLCATDIVSTYTASVYYLPDTVVYPIELEIQTLGSIVINYDIYSTDATSVNVPVVLDAALYTKDGASMISSKNTKMVFYQKPNICFSAITVATTTFIIRSITAY